MNKERVILIVPPYSDSASIFERVEKISLENEKKNKEIRIYPPLGLLYLAGNLVKLENLKVELIDSAALRLNQKDIIQILKQGTFPRIVGISLMSVNLFSVASLIKAIKSEFINPPLIVVGGPHISKVPQNTFDLKADYGFVGDADQSFKQFVQNTITNKPINDIPGLIWKKDGEIKINPPLMIKNLSSLPHPYRELVPKNAYVYPAFAGYFTSVVTTRGCPFNCIYCGVPHKRHYFERNVEDVIDELQKLRDYDYINFVDDCFTTNRKRTVKLCQEMIKEKFKFRWGCATRIDCVDPEVMKLMRQAGCYDIRFGVESGNEEIRHQVKGGKRITNDFYHEMLKEAKKAGLTTVGFFLLGLPNETLKTMKETIEFAKKVPLDFAYFGTVIPVPGSKLFEIAKSEGKLDDSIWIDLINGKTEIPQYIPGSFTLEQVKLLCRKADFEFYLRPSYILKRFFYITNFREFSHHAKMGIRLFWNRLDL